MSRLSPLRLAAMLGGAALLLPACSNGTPPQDPPATSGGAGSASATGATTAPGVGVDVPAEYFGMHVGLLGVADVPTPPTAGAIRLWDSGVSWREIEPTEGQFNWAPMDTAVSKAEAMGAKDILWVHGSPPQWAAQDPEAKGIYGPGSSSAPKEAAYLNALKAVAQRYKGRIGSYQVWNEANIKIFYRGTPEYLGELTGKAKDLLKEVDPAAKLVGASTTVRKNVPYKSFYTGYSETLAKLGWPLDAMAVHLYPLAEQGPEARDGYIRGVKGWLAERGWTGPLWDTEVNFGDRRDFAEKKVTVPAEIAPAYVARTYLDGIALGLAGVYWYTWNDHSLGIDMVDPATGSIQPAGQAYLTVMQWLAGSKFQECVGEITAPTGTEGAVSTCQFILSDGTPAQITWTHTGTTALAAPGGTTALCSLDGSCNNLTPGAAFEVGPEPVMLKLG